MLRQSAAEVVCFAFIAAIMGVQLVSSQQVTCFINSITCTSTSVTITGTQPAGQCCLNRGGGSYRTGTSTVCTPCVVYGFFQSPNSNQPLTSISQKEGSQLIAYFGFVNGTFSGSRSVSFSVPNSPRYIKSFTTGVLTTGAARQPFTLNIISDNIALQPPSLVPVSATVDGSSEFVLPFNAALLDADVVNIGFRESDYSVNEGASPPDQYPKIKLAKDKIIAQPLSIQVVPLTVDQFRPLGIPLPDGISLAGLSSPAQFISNGTMDFNNSIQNLTFGLSQSELSPFVGIVDDQINEADQQFICIVRLTDPSVNASGNVIIKNPSTVIRIVDNDPMYIGFGNGTYTFTKGMKSLYEDTVRLVKEDGVVSEQTFKITVIAQSNAVENEATYTTDYTIGGRQVQMFDMRPDEQYIPIVVEIYDTGLTGTLKAQLSSSQQPNTPSFSARYNPITQLVILDNKVAIVGFTDGGKVVTEGEDFSECVAVTDPLPGSVMKLSFFIQVLLIPDTADDSDVSVARTILGPFDDTNRMYCFNTTALADEYIEGTQTFSYSLTLIGDVIPVKLFPNITMVTIKDNTTAIVQFTSASYSVLENAGSVNVCLNKSLQTQTDFSVTFYPAELIPQSAQAGKDFNGSSITATFSGDNSQLCVSIPINDNSIALEGIKTFHVTFSIPSVSWLRMGTLKDSNLVIIDNDVPTVALTSTTYTTQEGQPAQVCVTKDLLTASDIIGVITANPIVASNAATPLVQFKNGSYPFTIAAGLSVTCVNITTYDDKIMTGPRVFSASIGQATSTGGAVTVGNPSTAQVTIVDNNVIPFSFVTNNVPVPKKANTTTVCLQKLGNSTQTISVTVYTTPLTALPGVDFTPVQQTLSFLPSDTIKCLSIPILDDGIAFTGDKIFKVGFNTSSTTLYPKGSIPESTVTIQDQSVVRVSFTAPIYVVRQSQGPATVCIVATPRAAVPVTVTVVAGEDPSPSARASTDFSAGSYVITIPANIPPQSPFCTNIPIVDSQVAFQPNKTFTVTLQPPNSRVVVSPPSQVLIVDDHPIIVTAVTPNGTYPSVPQVCFKSDRSVAVSTVVKIVGDITTVASTRKTVSTYIVFSPNNAVACVDLSNYTEISTVILKPEEPPKSDPNFKPPPPGANVVMIIIPQSTPAPNVATVNDTVIGDPLYAVPLLLNISNPLDGPALCYEVHGAPNTIFNLVSDSCTSVNAYYSPAIISSDPVAINVITKIGVVAIDSSGVCQWIKVDLDGCTAFVNGVQVNTSYQQADIGVRRIGDRVRVSVPNCGKPNLVSWVVCEQTMGVRMMRFVISRGLNLTPTSHGIIGQFWNIPISMVHYSGTLPRGYDSIDPLYIITVNPPRSPSRSFLGEQYGRTWDKTKKTCYYSGGAQGGRTGVATPDNSVIEGTYTDYITSDLFSTQFLYTQFKGCPSGSVA